MQGKGYKKTLGATLIGLGAIGAAGNIGSGEAAAGVIGGSILAGIGGLLIKADKRQSGSGIHNFDKLFKAAVNKRLKQSFSGSGYKKPTALNFIQQHINTPIHPKDIFGDDWKQKGKMLLQKIQQHQAGSGIIDTLKNKAYKKLSQFVKGKTKFKPSDLINYMSGAVGLAGAASGLIPGVNLVSVPVASAAALGLKSGAHILKQAGRGNQLYLDPDLAQHAVSKLQWVFENQETRKLLTRTKLGVVLGVSGAALIAAYKIYKKIASKKGSGLKLSGSGVNIAGGSMS